MLHLTPYFNYTPAKRHRKRQTTNYMQISVCWDFFPLLCDQRRFIYYLGYEGGLDLITDIACVSSCVKRLYSIIAWLDQIRVDQVILNACHPETGGYYHNWQCYGLKLAYNTYLEGKGLPILYRGDSNVVLLDTYMYTVVLTVRFTEKRRFNHC